MALNIRLKNTNVNMVVCYVNRQEYVVIDGAQLSDLDTDKVMKWVEETWYDWDGEVGILKPKNFRLEG